jgi:pyridoxamine 5'-phosphate oxidase family protein
MPADRLPTAHASISQGQALVSNAERDHSAPLAPTRATVLHSTSMIDCVGVLKVGSGSLFSSRESLNRRTEMSVFTPAEITYLQSQRLARVATSGPGGQPHVVPVSFRYNPDEDTIDVGGHGFAQRKKYRDVQRNPRVAIVIDDLATVDPWRPRMIEIRGLADILPTGGEAIGPGFDPPIFRIRPRRIVSIGIDGDEPFSSNARSVP